MRSDLVVLQGDLLVRRINPVIKQTVLFLLHQLRRTRTDLSKTILINYPCRLLGVPFEHCEGWAQ